MIMPKPDCYALIILVNHRVIPSDFKQPVVCEASLWHEAPRRSESAQLGPALRQACASRPPLWNILRMKLYGDEVGSERQQSWPSVPSLSNNHSASCITAGSTTVIFFPHRTASAACSSSRVSVKTSSTKVFDLKPIFFLFRFGQIANQVW